MTNFAVQRKSLTPFFGIAALLMIMLAVAGGRAQAMASQVTRSNVYWIWDGGGEVLGTSTLVRTHNGISASVRSSQLPAGQAMTLWFVVYNNPAACTSNPCDLADFNNPATQADALWATGNIVGGSDRTGFGGQLAVGDASGSLQHELGQSQLAIGLLDPFNAEVQLLVHSHGPALSGQALKAQLTSFLGGCDLFLGGADGIADGPADVPVNVGECSTIQASVHQ
jgi:hypothetical protein